MHLQVDKHFIRCQGACLALGSTMPGVSRKKGDEHCVILPPWPRPPYWYFPGAEPPKRINMAPDSILCSILVIVSAGHSMAWPLTTAPSSQAARWRQASGSIPPPTRRPVGPCHLAPRRAWSTSATAAVRWFGFWTVARMSGAGLSTSAQGLPINSTCGTPGSPGSRSSRYRGPTKATKRLGCG